MSDPRYRIVQIPKGNGKFRTIYVPTRARRAELRLLVGKVAQLARRADKSDVQHGFTRGKSPVTCAMAHIGHSLTWTADLKDCFDSISENQLKNKLPKEILAEILVDGAPRQGLPTSPAAANLALSDLDTAILKWAEKKDKQIIYTRYADDLTISCDDSEVLKAVSIEIPQIVSRCGFKLATHKTRVYSKKAGRRPVVGIAVDHDGIFPTRKVKRRLRAAEHQTRLGNEEAAQSAAGLREWCKLKPPKQRKISMLGSDKSPEDEIRALLKAWKLPGAKEIDNWPVKEETILAPDIIITGDPVMVLGMSTWTTGWVSCMQQPNGQYRKGTLAWAALKGTRIAALLSDKKREIAGVTRCVMKARTLVHELRNGSLIYDRLYGDVESRNKLAVALEAAGITRVKNDPVNSGIRVVGNISSRYKPYCDNLRRKEAKHSNKTVWVFEV